MQELRYQGAINELSHLEKKFLDKWMRLYPSTPPIREHEFHQKRKWRLDFAWPAQKIAVEVQGFGPGHNSLPGMEADYEKHLHALLYGWRVVFLTGNQINKRNLNYVYQLISPSQQGDAQRIGNDLAASFRRKIDQKTNSG